QGVRVQGDSHRNFSDVLLRRISVGSVYKISGYTVRAPRPSYRTCQFGYWLTLTPTTQFELQPGSPDEFPEESFEFVPLPDLGPRLPPCAFLTAVILDLFGKIVTVGKPNHVERESAVAPVQTITIADFGGTEVEVSLWSEHSTIIDAEIIVLDDLIRPAVVGFSGLRINLFNGYCPCRRCRTQVVPPENCPYLCFFPLSWPSLTCTAHTSSYSRYRLKLLVSDGTGETSFALLGHTANRVLTISASDMAVAYPDNYGELPPPLQAIVGQNVTFKVQLPRTGLGSTYNDFPISKIWGLLVPRAHLSTRLASVSDTTSLRYTNRRFPSFHTFPDTGFYTCSTPLTFACAQAACITRDSFATGRHC
ncbi:Replication protein A 70 kDa DNA-binding subunit B, partial [Linum grandiflorum]